MSKKRILILGAGLAGLSIAWHLQKKGIDCQIFERESEIGGLCRSKKIDRFTFDYSGHLLHFKHDYAFNLVKNLLGDNLVEHKRSAWIYSPEAYTPYPFQANLHGLPADIAKECLLGFIKAAAPRHSERSPKGVAKNPGLNFLDWINHTFGSGIAKHFMVPYNTKFWTLPPEKLTCEWLDGFIPVPSLTQLVEGTVTESHRQFGYNAKFWYPKKGSISELPLALSSQLKNIYTGCEVTEINLKTKEIKLNSGEREKFDYLITTLPLPEIPHLIKGLPSQIVPWFKKLRWNSIFNLNLGIEKKDYSGRHWVYFPQKEVSFFRVGFHHNFSNSLAPVGKGSLYVEVSYSQEKPIDKKNIVPRIIQELENIGILTSRHSEDPEQSRRGRRISKEILSLRNGKIYVQDVNDINYGYPIYDKNYQEAREAILNYLSRNNIFPAGRYGSWRYFSMEDTILDGKRAANSILKNV